MTTKERLHKLIDRLPDSPETERRLAAAEHDLEPSGSGEDRNGDAPGGNLGRDFLISVAHGTSGLDLDQLRTVRDRAWR
jgi:hypothetical protein